MENDHTITLVLGHWVFTTQAQIQS